jgi:hypothetical protein
MSSSANDELIKLILSVEGKDQLAELRAAEAAVRDEMETLRLGYEAGSISQEKFLEGGKKLGKSAADLGRVIAEVGAATGQATAEEIAAAEASKQAWGDALRARAEGYARQERAAERAAQVTRQAEGDAMRARIDALAKSEQATDRFQSSQKRLLATVATGADSARYKLLAMGNLFDDLQYMGTMGLRPIINNVMQIAPSVGIAMIGIEILRKGVVSMMGQTDAAAGSIEAFKEKIEALEKKPHKIAFDYSDLAAAKAKLEEIEKLNAAYEAARKTKAGGDLAAQAVEVAQAYGGGSDQLFKSVAEIDRGTGVSHGTGEDEEKARMYREELANPTLNKRTGARLLPEALAKQQLAEVEARIAQANGKFAQDEVGKFLAGDPMAIARMKGRAAAHPGAFATVGPGGVTGAEAIAGLPGTQAEVVARQDQEQALKDADESNKTSTDNYKKRTAKAKQERDQLHKFFRSGRTAEQRKQSAQLGRFFQGAAARFDKHDKDAHKDDNAKLRGNVNRMVAEKRRREALPIAKQFQRDTGASNTDAMVFGKTVAHEAENLRVNGGMDTKRSEAAAMQVAGMALGIQGSTLDVLNLNSAQLAAMQKQVVQLRQQLETAKAQVKNAQPDSGTWSPFN